MQPEDALAQADLVLVGPALGEVAVEGVILGLGRVDRVVCRGRQKRAELIKVDSRMDLQLQ